VRDDLLMLYERELAYLRQLGADFAGKYPKVASRLLIEPNRCEDPHVERLLEAFAFLSARIHLKIDDEFPELTQSLLGILYPHYVRPLPSMSIAEFSLDPEQGQLTTGFTIPKGATLLARPVNGYRCPFRTSYDVNLWPVQISSAQWTSPERMDPPIKAPEAASALRLRLNCRFGADFSNLGIPSLRFFLNGESSVVYPLYEMLANNTLRILLRDPSPRTRRRPIVIPQTALRPLGFEEDQGMLPYPRRSFIGYRLLQEYFAFPEKFLFFDLNGLNALNGSGFGDQLEIVFLFTPCERSDWDPILQLGVSDKTIRLHCSPIINLFEHTADPILITDTRHEYPVVPDARRNETLEVFSIESIVGTHPNTPEVTPFEPFYSFRHSVSDVRNPFFWHATRRASRQKFDESTDLWITLVDLEGNVRKPTVDTLTVRCLCTNREIPSRLAMGSEDGDFDMEIPAPLDKITALRKPTSTIRPAISGGAIWRLVSQLSLNYLSLVEEGREALQEILRLYAPQTTGSLERQIEGIVAVNSRRHYARVVTEAGISFVRGTRVDLLLDEDCFVGAGAFLMASVIDRFLGLYVSMNSFSQLEIRTTQRKEMLRRWPARAGYGVLL